MVQRKPFSKGTQLWPPKRLTRAWVKNQRSCKQIQHPARQGGSNFVPQERPWRVDSQPLRWQICLTRISFTPFPPLFTMQFSLTGPRPSSVSACLPLQNTSISTVAPALSPPLHLIHCRQMDPLPQLAIHFTSPSPQQFARHRAFFFPELANHPRVFRKLRRRLRTTGQPVLFTSSLTVLRELTKLSRASFDVVRTLFEVEALRRMAAGLAEPGCSKAIHIINQALQFCSLTYTSPDQPAAHHSILRSRGIRDTQQCFTSIFRRHQDQAIPFHLPTRKLGEAARKTLRGQLVHNHRRTSFPTSRGATSLRTQSPLRPGTGARTPPHRQPLRPRP